MAKAPCKCKKVECEECPEWIFTFADLVMLMMGFFVILWVLKPSPNPKSGSSDADVKAQQEHMYVTIGEIRKGLGWEPDPHSTDPVDMAMFQRQRGTKEGAENEHIRDSNVGTDHDVQSIRPGKDSIIGTRLLFSPGSNKITQELIVQLREISEKIKGHNTIVLIKGHTSRDDLPDTADAQQKMDLSLRRAQATADYLMANGVSPDVIRVQGCSTFEPIHQRAYTAEGQADNRRVEVTWTAQLVEDLQDKTIVPSTPLDEKAAPAAGPTTQPEK